MFINSPSFFISTLKLSSSPTGKSFEGIFGSEDKISLSSFSVSNLLSSILLIESFISWDSLLSLRNSDSLPSDFAFPASLEI